MATTVMCYCCRTEQKGSNPLKRVFAGGIILFIFLSLSACGRNVEKAKEEPITAVALGMTLKQAMELEPALSEYDEGEYSCSKSFAGAEGKLLVTFSSAKAEATAIHILWTVDPTDGKGKDVYDALFAALEKIHGEPAVASDETDVESIVGVYDEAKVQWQFDGCTVHCTYTDLHDSGFCQVQYVKKVHIGLY